MLYCYYYCFIIVIIIIMIILLLLLLLLLLLFHHYSFNNLLISNIFWLFCLIMTDKSDTIDGACSIWHWPFDYINYNNNNYNNRPPGRFYDRTLSFLEGNLSYTEKPRWVHILFPVYGGTICTQWLPLEELTVKYDIRYVASIIIFPNFFEIFFLKYFFF